jgi:hypothetical protein
MSHQVMKKSCQVSGSELQLKESLSVGVFGAQRLAMSSSALANSSLNATALHFLLEIL